MQTEPIKSLDSREIQAQDFKRIPVDQVLFLEEPKGSEEDLGYVIPTKRSSKAGLRKTKTEIQSQQNIVDLLGHQANPQKIVNAQRCASSSYDANFYERLEECLHKQKFEDNTNLCVRPMPPLAYAVKSGYLDVVKYMIDTNENVNQVCTDPLHCYPYQLDSKARYYWPGFTPLEIAIKNQDIEMVKILLFHNENNYADIDLHHYRDPYVDVLFDEGKEPYWEQGIVGSDPSDQRVSAFFEALAVGNIEIIDLIFKSFRDPTIFHLLPRSLFSRYEMVKSMKRADIMKSWLAQYRILSGNKNVEISDKEVDLLLNSSFLEEIKKENYDGIKIFLDNNWPIFDKEFKEAYNTKNVQILDLLLQYDTFERRCISRPNSRLIYDLLLQSNDPCFDSLVIKYMPEYLPLDTSPIDALSILMTYRKTDLIKYVFNKMNVQTLYSGRERELYLLYFRAMRMNYLEIIQFFIENNLPLNDEQYNELLHYTLQESSEIFRFLVEARDGISFDDQLTTALGSFFGRECVLDNIHFLLNNFEFSMPVLDKAHSVIYDYVRFSAKGDDKILKCMNFLKLIDEKRNLSE